MHRMKKLFTVLLFTALAVPALAQETLTMEALRAADYMKGKQTFQGRCSACHTLADDSGDITGPNLWGMFDRVVGTKEGYYFSDALVNAGFVWSPDKIDAWLADPEGYLPGNFMRIPEAVADRDRLNLISFMLIETGAVDWPRPETNFANAQQDMSKPPSERFPSFWNHLMFNTVNYRWENGVAGEDFPFEAYNKADGTIATNVENMFGFWYINDKNFFCYALTGMPVGVGHMVECFPVAAMAIPRFADELWTSKPQPDVILHGGMLPGRPDWVETRLYPE
ncbi:MAG: c-type cytochrome [Gammaproteobacteria bacterium]|nr:c-type cytochrome [Gammaproteobacteria bacterium]MDP7093750.1 c-type cytochrome [Gammaproteobacteria bacterium]MDP7269830.1 c-type cytochrome [Gammaproteobacteria bacterium]